MLEIIHTEYRGYGYSLAILFYFACIALFYLVAQYVVIPTVKSVRGREAAVAVSPIKAAARHDGGPARVFVNDLG